MSDPSQGQTRFRFRDFDVDATAGALRRRGEVVRLQDLPFRLLVALLERPGELVTRAELSERLWGAGTFVDYDSGLNTAAAKLRDALGDDPDRPAFIETIPKRGYRWIGGLESAPTAVASPAVVMRSRRRALIGGL